MAEVTKKIKDVDKLFKEIVINGEVHTSTRYTPHRDYVPRSTTQVTQEAEHTSVQPEVVSTTQGEDVHAVNLNDVLHNFSDASLTVALQAEVEAREQADTSLANALSAEATARQNADTALQSAITAEATAREQANTVLSSNLSAETTARQNADTTLTNDLSAEATARQNADTALQSAITAEATARQNADTSLEGDIADIEAVIPNQASAQNQLADKAFVNSSVATNTANYISNNGLPFNSLAELEAYSGTVTNNDYAFVTGTDSAGNTYYDRYKATVVGSTVTWALEYRLNNSSFTAEQWATINSGLTQSSVDSSIASAIGDLDVASVGGTGKYIESISEADGKIVPVEKSLSTAVASGDSNPVTSDAVYQAIRGAGLSPVDTVQSGNMSPVTSNAVANYKPANATHADSADSATSAGSASSASRADQSARLLIDGMTWDGHFHWSGQSGQPTWLWGSNDGVNMYVWNPSNFSVNYAGSAGSAGSCTYAEVARGVSGGKTGVGGGTVYSVDTNTFYNGHSRAVIIVSRISIGYGAYFTNATYVASGAYASVPNFHDGGDFWFALY